MEVFLLKNNTKKLLCILLAIAAAVCVIFACFMPVSYTHLDVYKRQDDEAGQALAAFLHGQQVAEHLHGLAKDHIVGQNAAHAVAVQRAQPAVAIPLVLAQQIVQAFRRSILAVLHGVKAAADAAERIVAVETDAVWRLLKNASINGRFV